MLSKILYKLLPYHQIFGGLCGILFCFLSPTGHSVLVPLLLFCFSICSGIILLRGNVLLSIFNYLLQAIGFSVMDGILYNYNLFLSQRFSYQFDDNLSRVSFDFITFVYLSEGNENTIDINLFAILLLCILIFGPEKMSGLKIMSTDED